VPHKARTLTLAPRSRSVLLPGGLVALIAHLGESLFPEIDKRAA